MRAYTGVMKWLVKTLAAGTMVYGVFQTLHIFSRMGIYFLPVSFRSLFTGSILALVFLIVPPTKMAAKDKLPWYDGVAAFMAFVGGLYPFLFYKSIQLRVLANNLEIVIGIIMILLVLEAVRRTTSWALVVIVVVFLIYPPYSHYFPGLLEGVGYSLPRVIGIWYLYVDGMFGIIMGIIATLVVAYLLFAQLIFAGGAGKFLTDLSYSTLGCFRGGPAKGAVVASGTFGMISGSPLGNVVTTGSVTIPIMIKTGYKPHYAGAVEAVASTGGALMPPVMGAVAFIMAEFLDIPYASVCMAALWPAILYYIAIFLQVHYQACKEGLVGLPRGELPSATRTMAQGWHFFIPFVVLVYFLLIARYPAENSAFYAMAALILASLFKKEARMGPKRIFEGLEQTGMRMIYIVPVCAAAGLIIGSVGLTGLGIHLSSMLITVSGGNLAVLIIIAAAASVIMSMGLPWTACYILLAILVAPTLVSMGIQPVAAHLFLLYMGLIAFITPPVCVPVYAVCTISRSTLWPTGLQAVRLGAVAYLVPFIFIFEPSLILMGTLAEILMAMLTSLIGVLALASALEGYLVQKASWPERVLWLGGGIALIIPGWSTDIIGLCLVVVAVTANLVTLRRVREVIRNYRLYSPP